AAQVPERPAALRSPRGHVQTVGQRANDLGPRRLLEDDEIRVAGADDGRDRFFPAEPAVPEVVGEHRQGHEPCTRSSRTRYGCPRIPPRRVMTASRVAWMFTGRLTRAINRSRSGS